MDNLITEGKFKYIETRPGAENTLVLLHGLFGALSNFGGITERFGEQMNVVVPILPIYDLPLRKVGIGGILEHITDFIDFKGYQKIHVLGNSLGGHISLLYVLSRPEKIASLILTGSSGLFENAFGSSFPKRGNYQFIKEKTEATFYNKETATKELVDEVFDTVNDRNKALSVVMTAKSAIRHNVEDRLTDIEAPTLLIWGKEDNVTPFFVGEKFNDLIPNSRLVAFEKCGHAPMMEYPDKFNDHLAEFLSEVTEQELT